MGKFGLIRFLWKEENTGSNPVGLIWLQIYLGIKKNSSSYVEYIDSKFIYIGDIEWFQMLNVLIVVKVFIEVHFF